MGLWRDVARIGLGAAAAIVLLISMLGWHRYTSIGLDVGTGDGNDRTETAVRAKWFGDGTVHIGAGHGRSPHRDQVGLGIDPAAAILTNVRERRVGTLQSLVTVEWLAYPGVRDGWERWLVIPVWIPAVAAVGALRRLARPRQRAVADQ